ncbi:MAG: tetratricopeptide repeat protein [Gallionella sp.]|nr:tetratricopeptide repeat protein [Gallionella sp.]
MKFARPACWIFFGSMLAASGVYAQNSITALNIGDIADGATVIKVELAQPLDSLPAGFTTDTPPRIVLDFPDTVNGVGKSVQDFAKGGLRSANIVQAGGRTRLVINLDQMFPYNTKIEGSSLTIALQGNAVKAGGGSGILHLAEAKPEQGTQKTAPSPEAKPKKQIGNAAHEKLLRDADELIKNGKPAEAYSLLEPLEFEYSGEVRFDYLFGIAALDSGKADKATLAFERVLAVDPNFAGARMDMARAYYQLGDLQRAETEFNAVMKQNPPEAARVVIQKYLDAIVAYEQAKQTRITGYVEGVVGHDSNIANSSTQTFTFALNSPWSGLFPGNQLPPAAKLTGAYEGVNAGGEISRSLNANWGVYVGADLRQHGNMAQTAYDSSSMDGRIGLMYGLEQNIYKLSLTGGQSYTANSMRRDSLGMNAEWQHAFGASDQASAFALFGKNRASGVTPTSLTTDARIEGNTDQTIIGGGWVHIFADSKSALFGSIYFGKELDVAPVISAGLPNGGRVDGKKRFEGFRVGGQIGITDQLEGVVGVGWQNAVYGNLNNLIMARRSETTTDLSLGVNWHLDKLWTLKPQIAVSKKNSNLAIYSSDRTDASLTIRRDFR